MKVTAVIPHWNRRDLLSKLLENLRAQTRPFDEVIVVDNGSSDGSAERAEQCGSRVIRLDRNMGFAAAVNRGIAAAAGAEWVAILNNDVTLDPRWLDELLHTATDDTWFATGKILSAQDPARIDGLWDEISRGACAARIGAGAIDGPPWNTSRKIRMASMTAALFRRGLFAELGMLDERFESYLEDVEFGLRCAKERRFGMYEPAAVAWHQGSATWGQWNPDTVRLMARNQVLLAAKHFRGQPRWPIMAGQVLWGCVAARHGCGSAWWEGRRAGKQKAATVIEETLDKPAFRKLVQESERELLAAQRTAGMQLYWRIYTWLAPL